MKKKSIIELQSGRLIKIYELTFEFNCLHANDSRKLLISVFCEQIKFRLMLCIISLFKYIEKKK